MPDRRTFMAALAASAVVPAFAARAALPDPAAVLVRRYGDFYIVDGWVLTRSDVEALGIHAG